MTTMFSKQILEKVFADEEVQRVPVTYMCLMVHTVERVLEEMGYDFQFQQDGNGNAESQILK